MFAAIIRKKTHSTTFPPPSKNDRIGLRFGSVIDRSIIITTKQFDFYDGL